MRHFNTQGLFYIIDYSMIVILTMLKQVKVVGMSALSMVDNELLVY